MKIQDIRRARLAQLIAEQFKSQADFVSETGENQGEVSGLLKSKSFGEKKARKIELKCNLPEGWLDDEEGLTESMNANPGGASSDAPQIPPWIAPEAFRLLTLYYASDEDGRAEIMNTAIDHGGQRAPRIIHNEA